MYESPMELRWMLQCGTYVYAAASAISALAVHGFGLFGAFVGKLTTWFHWV